MTPVLEILHAMKYALLCLLIPTLFLVCCQSIEPEVQDSSVHESYPLLSQPDRVWNVAFLIMDKVYNTELTAPMDIFQHTIFHTNPGMKVFTIAKTTEPLTTFEGLVITPDYSYRDSFPPIDVLVVPSAEHHLDTDLEDEEMIAFVAKTAAQAQYTMSLCDGAFVLAQAGLLEDRLSTTFPSDIPPYKERFPQLSVKEDVYFVHDGPVITGAGGAKSFEPALYLCERLYGVKAAKGIAKGLVIDWNLAEIPKEVVLQQ